MAGATWACVICYDVTDDRRRTQLARTLAAYGRRVQYSVFEATLSLSLFDTMAAELRTLIDPGADRVHVYALCAACAARAVYLGPSAREERPGTEMVFIV